MAFTGFFPSVCLGQSESKDFPKKEIFLQFAGSFLTGNTSRAQAVFSGPPGGPYRPIPGTEEAVFSKSGRAFLGARYWFRPHHALELSFSYSANILRVFSSWPPVMTGESVPVQLFANNVALNYVRRLPRRGRLEPFVTVGAGLGLFNGIAEDDAWMWEKKFVVNFGAGADVQVTRRFLLRFEFRDFFSAQPTGGFLQAPGGATHNLVPSAGLVFRF